MENQELPDSKLEECDRLNDEIHEAFENVKRPYIKRSRARLNP